VPAPAIETRRLTKRFGGALAVDQVNLRVETGTVHGLLGRNGAGKSTLIRMLLGLVPPDGGSVQLFGREARAGDVAVRRGVAGFAEEPGLYPYLSARQNLDLLTRLDGEHGSERAEAALELVGLSSRRDERVGNLTTGMRQRLGLAAAILRGPRLLLLDEPTIGLDPAAAREVRHLLRELAGRGVTIFVSSHNMAEVDEICDSVLILNRGRVAWNGEMASLRAGAPAPLFRIATSDDDRTLAIARDAGLEAERSADGAVSLLAEESERDAFVLALAREDVATRRLEPVITPLDAVFAALTADDGFALSTREPAVAPADTVRT